MLGFKIFDNDQEQTLNELFQLALKDNLAIEVAIYNNNAEDFIHRMNSNELYSKLPKKSIHLNYKNYLINNIKEQKYYNNMLKELDIAKSLGINRGVIHYQTPSNFKIHLENFTKEAIINNLSILHSVAKKEKFTFYIENTFIFKMNHPKNDLIQHRILWDTILELGYNDYLGICLDWGHVKAFTNDSLTDWLDYVEDLKKKNMPIYMHIHDNNSAKDLHKSLKESEELNLFEFNHEKDDKYISILKNVQEKYLNDSLILEYTSLIAKEHYGWTIDNLNK